MQTNYEVMYIVKPVGEALCQEVTKKVQAVITDNEGSVKNVDFWGKKRLAYEIDTYNDGFYVLITFKADKKAVRELDRVLKITEDVIRHMIIRKD